jgi:hypothetical protein
MGQPYKVAAKFFGQAEQRARVIVAMRAAGTTDSLFMQVDAPQKHRLPVEENVRTASLDCPEADVFRDLIGSGGDFNAVEFRLLG